MPIAERARRDSRPDEGLTLIEAVVAALLVAVLAAVVLGIILQTQSAQIGNRGRVAAANLAAREIDLVREEFMSSSTGPRDIVDAGTVVNPHPLAGGTAGEPLEIDGTPYTVKRTVAWNAVGLERSACDGGDLIDYPTLNVTVEVTWPNMGSIRPVVSHASLAPEKDAGIRPDHESFIAVKVLDSKGAPNPGRSVTVHSTTFSRTVSTDHEGCAVADVLPAAEGTEYWVTLGDTGFVDMSNTSNPTTPVGIVSRGQLNNEVSFVYDRAATVVLNVVSPLGLPLTDLDVSGGQSTLVTSQSTGTSSDTVYPVTGLRTTISGLWPTTYSAYFGTTAPAEIPSLTAGPGETITLDIEFNAAEVTVTNLPAGTTELVAVPSGSGQTCATSGVRRYPVGAPAATIGILPGEWELFAVGSYFSCSPGQPGGVDLGEGLNEDVAWIVPSTIRLTGSVPPGSVWAVDTTLAGALSTCPGPEIAALAQDVTASLWGPAPLLAGDWYLYVTDGAADGACQGLGRGSASPFVLEPLQDKPLVWPAHTVTVTVTGIEAVSGSSRPRVFLGSGGPATTGYTCTASGMTSTTHTLFSLGQPTSSGGSVPAINVPEGTWYLFGVDPRTTGSGRWNPTCRHAGTVIVGPASGPLTIDYRTTNPIPVVGP